MRRAAIVAALLVALPGVSALAHEAGARGIGVVERVDAGRIVLKARDGHSLAYAVTPETRFVRAGKPVGREQVEVGERAVVHATPAGEGMRATEVRLGKAPPPR
jgi:hypothetical protein